MTAEEEHNLREDVTHLQEVVSRCIGRIEYLEDNAALRESVSDRRHRVMIRQIEDYRHGR